MGLVIIGCEWRCLIWLIFVVIIVVMCIVIWFCVCCMWVSLLVMLGIICFVVFVGVDVCRLVILLSSG